MAAPRRRDPLSLGSHGLPSGSPSGNQQSASNGASSQSWSISPTSSWAPSPPWAVGVASQPQQPPSRSGSGTPAGQLSPSSNHWNRRDGRSVSVPPIASGGSPQPVAFAPILPPAASSAAAPPPAYTPSRLQAPPSGRPRLGSSPGRVLSSSGSRTMPSPSASGSFQHGFTSAPSPSPSRLTVLPDSSPAPISSSLPPVSSGFQRRHSSPQYSSDVEDLDESGSPRKPASARALAFSPEPPAAAAAPVSSTHGRPDSTDSLASWKRGTDRPKTSVAGRKPVYGEIDMRECACIAVLAAGCFANECACAWM
jgi:hypothetical protein